VYRPDLFYLNEETNFKSSSSSMFEDYFRDITVVLISFLELRVENPLLPKEGSMYPFFEKLHGLRRARNDAVHFDSLEKLVNVEYVDKINRVLASVPEERFKKGDKILLRFGIPCRKIFLVLKKGKFITSLNKPRKIKPGKSKLNFQSKK